MIPPIIHQLAPLLTHLTLVKLTVASHLQLGLRELLVLSLLALSGPASFTQLHRLLSIPRSAVTQIVDRLSARGLVERRQDSADRRRWFVELTPGGQDLLQRAQHQEQKLVTTAIARISDQPSVSEVDTFTRGLENLLLEGLEGLEGNDTHAAATLC